MNRLLSWLIVPGLAVGIAACDKKEGVPMPKTGAGEVKHQAKEPIGAVEKRSQNSFIGAIGQGTVPILDGIERPGGAR